MKRWRLTLGFPRSPYKKTTNRKNLASHLRQLQSHTYEKCRSCICSAGVLPAVSGASRPRRQSQRRPESRSDAGAETGAHSRPASPLYRDSDASPGSCGPTEPSRSASPGHGRGGPETDASSPANHCPPDADHSASRRRGRRHVDPRVPRPGRHGAADDSHPRRRRPEQSRQQPV